MGSWDPIGPYEPLEEQPAKIKMRRCLGGCDRMFRSMGPQNRICSKCKTLRDRDGAGVYDAGDFDHRLTTWLARNGLERAFRTGLRP